jgi:LacI family transcriptional regulator
LRSPHPRRIALAFSIGVPHIEGILRGVVDYARAHGPWHFDFNPETRSVPVASLARWRGDGIIGMIPTVREERRAAGLAVPVVNVSSAPLAQRLPAVIVDNRAVGAMAAAHLLERGFRRFGYYGLADVGYGRDRGIGFAEAVRAAGYPCATFHDRARADEGEPWRWERGRLHRWLRGLEPPVGLLAVHDYRGRILIDACAAIGLRVPHDVAVIGVDDDEVACEFAEPSLSSVALPGRDIGFQAAALLDRLMKGRPAPPAPIRVPPTTLTPRGSTDVLAIADQATAEAVRFIAGHVETATIDAAAERAGLSRRSLELRFRRWLGTTPHDHLTRVRVERARRLLLDPARPKLKEVARRCGFADPRRLNAAFTRLEGISPRAFRLRARAGPNPL